MHRGLGKTARQIAAPVDDVSPQGDVGNVGIELARSIEIGQGLGERPRIEVRDPAVQIGSRIFRIEPDRLAVVRDSAVEVVLGQVEEAAVVEGQGVFGIKPRRLGVIRDRAIEVALFLVRVTAAVEGDGEFRL